MYSVCARRFQGRNSFQTDRSLQLGVRTSRFRSPRCCRLFSSSSEDTTTFHNVEVKRDVRYSSHHPRNVMDIYSPKERTSINGVIPALLFVHGGMWLRGCKKQYSNLGLCLAQHGGAACIMNYRLAGTSTSGGNDSEETGHPHQVMDVARAIAFIIRKSVDDGVALHLYVGGHSAGAHLAALVLSDPQYLRVAMKERDLDYDLLGTLLKGYIGMSGVYNLRRLAMSPLAAVTIGPAFQGKEESDVTLDASPVQVILRAHDSIQPCNDKAEDILPPLATVPILLLNAESDFHLKQDTSELLTALDHFSESLPSDDLPLRQSAMIANRNHLSIMGEFGNGLIDENEMADELTTNDESWTLASVFQQSRDALSAASAYILSDSAEEVDEASTRVLQFMRLK